MQDHGLDRLQSGSLNNVHGYAHLADVGTLTREDFVSVKIQEAYSSKLLSLAKRWTSLESKRLNYFDA